MNKLRKSWWGMCLVTALAVLLLAILFMQSGVRLGEAKAEDYDADYTSLSDETLDELTHRREPSDLSPQVTVFVHGLGGAAFHWSNDGNDQFAYEADSMPERLRQSLGSDNVQIFVIRVAYDLENYTGRKQLPADALSDPVDPADDLNDSASGQDNGAAGLRGMYRSYKDPGAGGILLYDCNEQNANMDYMYPDPTADSELAFSAVDTSKHTILIFEQWRGYRSENNDFVYSQLEYCLDAFSYQYYQSKGVLPTYNFIAHSKGGLTSMQYALAHPNNVASIYTMGAPFSGSALGSIKNGDTYPCLEIANMHKDYKYLDDSLDYAPGVRDIVENTAVADSYRNYWNDHYDAFYSHIHFCPIGSYVTVGFLTQTILELIMTEDIDPNCEQLLRFLFSEGPFNQKEILFTIMGPAKDFIEDIINDIFDKIYLTTTAILSEAGVENPFVYQLIEVLRNISLSPSFEYEYIGTTSPSLLVFLDDIFIDLDSQIAEGYQGRDVKLNVFDSKDQYTIGKSANNIGIAHNLETHAPDIINFIANDIETNVLDIPKGFDYIYDTALNGWFVVNYSGSSTNGILEVPDEYQGKPIVGIAGFAYSVDISGKTSVCPEIKEVVLPSSVKYISYYAFSGMKYLQKVSFSSENNIEEIRTGAFANCASLADFEIGPDVNRIDTSAFYGCTSLSAHKISSANTSYYVQSGVLYSNAENGEDHLISYPAGKTDVSFTVPNNVIYIDEQAFAANTHLQSLALSNVSNVGRGAFLGCTMLSQIEASHLEVAEEYVFDDTAWYQAQNSEFITLGQVLLRYNGSAENVELENYYSVAPYAFLGCESVKSVEIGNGIHEIGFYSFGLCDNLTDVYISNTNQMVYSLGDYSFSSQPNVHIPKKFETQYSSDLVWGEYNGNLSSIKTTVQFESNGGTVCDDIEFYYGQALGELPVPVKSGETFNGWYYNADFSGDKAYKADLWTGMEDEITLYAAWEVDSYRIWYVTDFTQTEVIDSFDGYYTVYDEVVFETPQKEGMTFCGWYYDMALTQSAGTGLPVGSTGEITLYAKWEQNLYKATLHLNDSAAFPASFSDGSREVVVDVPFGISEIILEVPVRPGYTFNGWTLGKDTDDFITLDNGQIFGNWSIAEDVDLYADWTANHYYIQITKEGEIMWLSSNGENRFSDTKVAFEYGSIFEDVDSLEAAFAAAQDLSYVPGKIFNNFTVKDDEGEEVKFNFWMQIGQFESEEVVELSAAYINEKYEVLFSDFAVVAGKNPYICSYGETINYLEPGERLGQVFVGWYVDDIEENDIFIGTPYAPGTKFDTFQIMPDLSDHREETETKIYLIAKYVYKEYSVQLYVNSELFESFSVTYEQNYHFSVPTLPGQNFIGWLNKDNKYVTDSSGAVNDVFWAMENTSTIVLTADFEIIIYQITFCEECLGKSLTPIEYNVFSDTINLKEEVGTPQKSGYRFKGWYDSCAHTGDSITEIASGSIGDVELHAAWDQLLYVYYYDVNSQLLYRDEAVKGETIDLLDIVDAGYNNGYTWNGYLNKSTITVQANTNIYLREKYWSELYNAGYYEIWTANQLNQIRSHSDETIHLMTNITYTENWTPIPVFSGELYMYGHTVTYQHNNVAYNASYGFIKELTSSGRIINGTFVPKIKATASGSGYVEVAIGGAVGINRGELSRVKVESKIGSNNDSYNSSSNPNVDIHVKHPYYYVGGIVGQNYGVIESCWNYASIGGDASNIGGIVGVNMESGEIIKAYNHGDIWYEMSISRTAYVGGVAGTVADGGYMNNISNYGKITFAMLSSTVSQTNVSYLANIAGSACETATITIYGCFGTVSVANALIGKISGFQIDAVKQNGDPIAYSFPKPGSGGSGNEGGGCVALGTLITLADGTQVPVESLTGNEMLLVWDMKTGTFGTAPVLFIDSDPYGLYNVIYLSFSDGTGLEVITEHALWDYNLNKYVFMDENAMQYIGHWFNKQSINIEGQLVYSKVQLVDVTVSVEYSVAYSPVTYSYLCYYVNGMLSMPGATQGLINIFEVDAETMKYDEAQMQADIAQYGLFTYEEFAEMFPISEEVFEAFNGKYLKVAMGKGLIDAEGLQMLIERYAEFLSVIG